MLPWKFYALCLCPVPFGYVGHVVLIQHDVQVQLVEANHVNATAQTFNILKHVQISLKDMSIKVSPCQCV